MTINTISTLQKRLPNGPVRHQPFPEESGPLLRVEFLRGANELHNWSFSFPSEDSSTTIRWSEVQRSQVRPAAARARPRVRRRCGCCRLAWEHASSGPVLMRVLRAGTRRLTEPDTVTETIGAIVTERGRESCGQAQRVPSFQNHYDAIRQEQQETRRPHLTPPPGKRKRIRYRTVEDTHTPVTGVSGAVLRQYRHLAQKK